MSPRAGLGPDQLYDTSAPYWDATTHKLWRLAEESAKDPYLGLKVAAC